MGVRVLALAAFETAAGVRVLAGEAAVVEVEEAIILAGRGLIEQRPGLTPPADLAEPRPTADLILKNAGGWLGD